MSTKKKSSKNAITAGVLITLYLVTYVVIGAISMPIPVLFLLMPMLVALFAAPTYHMLLAKTKSSAAIFIASVLPSIILVATGHIPISPLVSIPAGIIALLIAKNGNYEDFKKNEIRIGEEGLLGMSLLTQNMLSSIDYSSVADVRINNFNILHENLGLINEFKLNDKSACIPMVYPFLIKKDIRSELIAKGIFVATYWIGQKDRSYGDILEKYLLPLPIDQRYSDEEMEYIVREIKKII